MWELEKEIELAKAEVSAATNTGQERTELAGRIEALISLFYDDIGEIKNISLPRLFELFLLKTLYLERGGRDLAVLDYLAEMLSRFLWARELSPLGPATIQLLPIVASLEAEIKDRATFQNLFEAYRKLGDTSLFLTGLFPRALGRRHPGRRRQEWLRLDPARYVELGQRYYELAARHEFAQWTGQGPVLAKLSHYFQIYREALNEASERYILGFDMNIIADKMLDQFNLYRRTGQQRHLENARKYAAILRVNSAQFPRLFRHRRVVIL